ncbi:MAG: DUF3592 domain-containing protein [Chloroflexales bacterium]
MLYRPKSFAFIAMHYRPRPHTAAAILVFWVACLGICAGALGMAWAERISFDRWGETAPGEILEVGRPSARSPYVVAFRYTITLADGLAHTYTNRRFVTEAVATSVRSGTMTTVVYMPDRPAVSDILGNRFALLGDLTWSTIILTPIALFCATLCWLSAHEFMTGLRYARGCRQAP